MRRLEKEQGSGILTRLEQWICERWSHRHVMFTSKKPELPSQEQLSQAESSVERITVLAITYSKSSHLALERAAIKQGWVLLWAESWGEADGLVEQHETGVVLLDRGLLGADWRDALQLLLQPAHRCCVILLTASERDGFCEEFLEDGGCQVLSLPIQDSALIEAVQSAWTFWKGCISRAYRYS